MPQTTAELPEVKAQERRPSVRSLWLRQVILWHWVSSGVCLAGMLLFTVTGITLNHAAEITASPKVTKLEAQLPPALQSALKRGPVQGKSPLPAPVADWLAQRFSIHTMAPHAEWSDGEVYVSLPRPGGDAWLAMDRAAGTVVFESTSRGWVSYLNDLHKGRHTGPAWSIFIDVLAAACLVFTLTGFLLLQTHAAKRPSTWPLVALGLIAPLLLMLIFVHR